MFFSVSASTYLGECGPGDQHGTHLALGKEEGIAHHHACHEVCHMRELVGSAAVPHSIDAAVACLQLVTHLSAISQISGCIIRSGRICMAFVHKDAHKDCYLQFDDSLVKHMMLEQSVCCGRCTLALEHSASYIGQVCHCHRMVHCRTADAHQLCNQDRPFPLLLVIKKRIASLMIICESAV